MIRSYITLALFILNILASKTQLKTPELFVETSSFISAGTHSPFWILSNNHGKYSNHWYNITYNAGFKTTFDTARKIDYAYGADIMNRADRNYLLYPHELYLALKLWFVDLHAGWREEVYGNAYPGLTSGNFLWSGNARPMPKISINIPEFTPVPFTKGFVEFKGNMAHGWFEKDRYVKGVLMHHKSLIGRIGGNFPLNFHYGLHHVAQWGGTSPNPLYGKMPDNLNAFWWILKANEGAPGDSLGGESINRYGNHIGSRNIGLDLKTKRWKTGFYWQTIFEDGSGKNWANITDGLWGIYWENKNDKALLQAVVLEFINTNHQSGPIRGENGNFIRIPDNYFNNYIYVSGWAYHKMTIGTPFITSTIFDSNNLWIVNNRVRAFHFGLTGNIGPYHTIKTFLTCSNNLGIYEIEFKPKRNNISLLIGYSLNHEKLKGELHGNLAMDFGEMYGNNVGLMVSYRRIINGMHR